MRGTILPLVLAVLVTASVSPAGADSTPAPAEQATVKIGDDASPHKKLPKTNGQIDYSSILQLTISTPDNLVYLGETPHVTATITNMGDTAITLPRALDYSDTHWRMPEVIWSVRTPRSKEYSPVVFVPWCGNMNPETIDDLVEIKPGDTKELDITWVSYGLDKIGSRDPGFRQTGRYSIYLTYTNVPGGKPTAAPTISEMTQRFSETVFCKLKSNVLVFRKIGGPRPKQQSQGIALTSPTR